MKKLLALMLAATLALSLVACGGGSGAGDTNTPSTGNGDTTSTDTPSGGNGDTTSADTSQIPDEPQNITPEDIAGTYQSVSLFQETAYQLNANTTYDRIDKDEKGTYTINGGGGFTLQPTSDMSQTFAKKDNFYYIIDKVGFADSDDDYGLKPTFDNNGRSNQSFSIQYDSAPASSYWYEIFLELNEDGTFRLPYYQRNTAADVRNKGQYEGEYYLDDYVLNLNHQDGTIKFLFLNDTIYCRVFEKSE